ncbi:MAG: acetate kinase, partial [Steroidobacteraceae bacterium]
MKVILVVNAGSSSVKVSTFAATERGLARELRGQISGLGTEPRIHLRRGDTVVVDRALEPDSISHAQAFEHLLDQLRAELRGTTIVGVGHRVVHGGAEYMAPTIVDGDVLGRLVEFEQLAPLHQPHNLAAIRLLLARMPGVPQVACFDTAFHRSIPEIAQLYALPVRFADAGVRRYGFHGLSYEYIASVLPGLDERAAAGRTIVLHLGNGASMCAMRAGRSVATTMGFTALEGLPMGTRCGSIDPGVLLYLLKTRKLALAELERLLYHESGLLGLSGLSSDMRDLLESD